MLDVKCGLRKRKSSALNHGFSANFMPQLRLTYSHCSRRRNPSQLSARFRLNGSLSPFTDFPSLHLSLIFSEIKTMQEFTESFAKRPEISLIKCWLRQIYLKICKNSLQQIKPQEYKENPSVEGPQFELQHPFEEETIKIEKVFLFLVEKHNRFT